MPFNYRLFYFPPLLLLFLLLSHTSSHPSILKYFESKHALAHVIQSIRENNLEDMDNTYQQKCTTNSVCCQCHKNFKNTSFLEIHMNLHHSKTNFTPQDSLLLSLFDKRINSQLRFEMCVKLLDVTNISDLVYMTDQLLSPAEESGSPVQNLTIFQTPLSKTQIIDTCTIISYGAYHEPLWRAWIKGTLIFAFVVVFLVYYASIIDQITEKYFRKRRQKISKPHIIQEMY